jgi:hypothetical protein
MSSGHLVYFKLSLLLFGILLFLDLMIKLMWEVMQTCVIMHNIMIENDRKARAIHSVPYECQGPLAEVDHLGACKVC